MSAHASQPSPSIHNQPPVLFSAPPIISTDTAGPQHREFGIDDLEVEDYEEHGHDDGVLPGHEWNAQNDNNAPESIDVVAVSAPIEVIQTAEAESKPDAGVHEPDQKQEQEQEQEQDQDQDQEPEQEQEQEQEHEQDHEQDNDNHLDAHEYGAQADEQPAADDQVEPATDSAGIANEDKSHDDVVDQEEKHTEQEDAIEEHAESAEVHGEDPTQTEHQYFEETHDSRLPLHHVVMLYEGNEISLFPPEDDESSDTFFLPDEQLAYIMILELLQELRQVLGDSIQQDEELEISIMDLGISLSEVSSTLSMLLARHVSFDLGC